MFSCDFCEIFKNTLFDRTPPVVAFGHFVILIFRVCFSISSNYFLGRRRLFIIFFMEMNIDRCSYFHISTFKSTLPSQRQFLFHLKSSSCSRDLHFYFVIVIIIIIIIIIIVVVIFIIILSFWPCRRTA